MRVRPRSRLQMHSGNDLNRWTVSFADFMTLMFAVFVVLYAVSMSHKEQYKDVIVSITDASKLLNKSVFSSNNEGILTQESNVIHEDSGVALLSEQHEQQEAQAGDELSDVETLKTGWELSQLKIKLDALFLSELDNDLVKLDLDGDWLTIEIGGDLLFAGGSHSLLIAATKQLNKIADILKPVNNLLRIRGYTDQEIISNEIYRSNWELSAARAFSVLHAFNERGIAGRRMVVEAYGAHSLVRDSQGNVNQLASRRVVIAISKYAVVDPILAVKVEPPSKSVKNIIKKDSDEMQEIYLPNNRLIITTRQE